MTKPYVVALVDATELPPVVKIKAEIRYAASLEHSLGDADQVAAVYRAWVDASELDSTILDKTTAELAVQWPRAAKAAEDAGLHGLGHFEGSPHFQVTLERRSEPA